jgi:hypothetical protein
VTKLAETENNRELRMLAVKTNNKQRTNNKKNAVQKNNRQPHYLFPHNITIF